MSQSRHLSCSLQEVGGALGFCSETCWLSKAFDFLLLFKQAPLLCFAHTCTHIHTHAHTHTRLPAFFLLIFVFSSPFPALFWGPLAAHFGAGAHGCAECSRASGRVSSASGCVCTLLSVCVCVHTAMRAHTCAHAHLLMHTLLAACGRAGLVCAVLSLLPMAGPVLGIAGLCSVLSSPSKGAPLVGTVGQSWTPMAWQRPHALRLRSSA